MRADAKSILRASGIYIAFSIIFVATIKTGMLAKVGLAGNYGMGALLALFLTSLLHDRHYLLIGAAWILCLLSNSPALAERMHYSMDVMTASLIGIVTLPFVIKMMDN